MKLLTCTAWCESFLGNKHQAKIWQAYTVMSITDRWPWFSVHADCTLHMLLLASPAICCYPLLQSAVIQGPLTVTVMIT